MKKIIVLGVLFFTVSLSIQSQEKEKTKLKNRGIIKVFANYHNHFGDLNSNYYEDAMEIKRAYLGYKAKLSKEFSTKIILDVGNIDNRYFAYLKNASLKYKKNKWTVNVGMIATKQFKVQEKFWGYRYLQKSFQDEYKYNSSADLGLNVQYAFLKNLSVDFIIQNGEGYKNVEPTGHYRTGLGTRLKLSYFTIYLYYDISAERDIFRENYAGMLGVKLSPKFRFAAEYNMQLNHKFKRNHNLSGYSVYTTYVFNPKWEIFARFDNAVSNIQFGSTIPWNIKKDERLGILGMQFHPIKGVKIAVNYRRSFAMHKEVAPDNINSIFLNLEYKF